MIKRNLNHLTIISSIASKFFNGKVNEFLEKSDSNQYKALNKLYQALINQFILMTVETDDINEAYIIFESLNARGKALETADLLKNHILRMAQNDLPSATELGILLLIILTI